MNIVFFFTWNAIKVYRQWVPCGRNSSYSFPSVVLKLCRCFRHGMKMCMWFGYNTLIIFSHFFCYVDLVSFLTWNAIEVYTCPWRRIKFSIDLLWNLHWSSVDLSDENVLGTLWAPFLLQFSTNCLETLQMFSTWNEDMHMVWYNTLIIFSRFFCLVNLVSFFYMNCYQSV